MLAHIVAGMIIGWMLGMTAFLIRESIDSRREDKRLEKSKTKKQIP